MGGFFSFIAPVLSVVSSFMRPSPPSYTPPPPPPVQAPPAPSKEEAIKAQADMEAERKRAATARGLSSTKKTGGLGVTDQANTEKKTLLGS